MEERGVLVARISILGVSKWSERLVIEKCPKSCVIGAQKGERSCLAPGASRQLQADTYLTTMPEHRGTKRLKRQTLKFGLRYGGWVTKASRNK